MFLPHEIIDCLSGLSHTPSPLTFQSLMLGDLSSDARVEFWDHVRKLPPWEKHPMLSDNNYNPEFTIGLTIHGDGAAMFREEEMFVWSISSVFAMQGMCHDVLVFKIPVAIVPERFMRTEEETQLNTVPFVLVQNNS